MHLLPLHHRLKMLEMLGISSDPPANLPVPGSVFLRQTRPPSPRLRRGHSSLLNQPHALLHRRHFHPRIIRIPIFIRTNNFSDRKWIVFKPKANAD